MSTVQYLIEEFTAHLEIIFDPQTASHRTLAALTNLIFLWDDINTASQDASTILSDIMLGHACSLDHEFKNIIDWYNRQTRIRAQLSELERKHLTVSKRMLRSTIGKAEVENLGGRKTLLWTEKFETTISDRAETWATRIERVATGFRFQRAKRTFTGVKLECDELEKVLVDGFKRFLEADQAWAYMLKIHVENRRKVVELLGAREEKKPKCVLRNLKDGFLDLLSDVEFKIRNL